ncbi:MAG: hypothetical protein RLZZ612_433 [Pseudomonadota bacterium]|jgi:TPR repeat protein
MMRLNRRTWLGLWASMGSLHTLEARADVDESLAREQRLTEALRRPEWGLYQGYALYKMAKYDEAHAIWLALARKGNAEAWFHLGTLAEDGKGEPLDRREALQRYEQAAQGGSVKAMRRLALVFMNGALGPIEPAQALVWLERLAAQGDAEAQRQAKWLRQRNDIEGQCHGNH